MQTEPYYMSPYNTHPIFWINDTVHILKCLRNNFLTAGKLEFFDNNASIKKTAKWKDLEDLFNMERNDSSLLACSRLTRLAINPPLIADSGLI